MIRDDALAAVVVNHEHWSAAVTQIEAYRRDSAELFAQVEWLVVDNGPTWPPATRNGMFADPAQSPVANALGAPLTGVCVEHCQNRGFGAACNLALRQTRAPFVLLLNADLVPEPGFLNAAQQVATELAREPKTPASRTGIVGFRLLNSDATPQGSAGAFPTLVRVLAGLARPRATRKYLNVASARAVPWVTGACILLRRECIAAIGPFDERFFMYYEDVDLCRRASQAGWRVRFDPRPAVRHLHPFHSRMLSARMIFFARHGLLRYFSLHRPRWEFRTLGQIMLAECRLRGLDAGWSKIRAMVRQMLVDPDAVVVNETMLPP